MAHEDSKQLKALADELTNTADVFIHINKKSDIVPFKEECAKSDRKDRIIFAENRFKINWGGFSILQATFELMELALSRCKYDRLILMTGLDYPIKSPAEISKFFTENRNLNYATTNLIDPEKDSMFFYVYCWDYRLLNRFFQVCKRLCPFLVRRKRFIDYNGKKYFFYGPSPKWALTGECAEYVLDFWKNNPDFNKDFKFRHAPDDIYIATILNLSRFKDTLRDHNDLFLVNWTSEHNRTFELSDYDSLMTAGQLYAKKFYSGKSDSLITAMHEKWSLDNE